MNEVGTKDYWPAIAETIGWGYGSIGSHGIHDPAVSQRWHTDYQHSDFLTVEFTEKFWVPFLRDGTIRPADKPRELPIWIRALTLAPLRFFFPLLFIAAVAAGMIVFNKSAIWHSDGDSPARYPETDQSRVESFTFVTPPNETKSSLRKWTRVAPDRWRQEYPDGTVEFFKVVNRIHIEGCDGTVVSPNFEPQFQAFIPDKNCPDKEFLFRRLENNRKWIRYVPIRIQ